MSRGCGCGCDGCGLVHDPCRTCPFPTPPITSPCMRPQWGGSRCSGTGSHPGHLSWTSHWGPVTMKDQGHTCRRHHESCPTQEGCWGQQRWQVAIRDQTARECDKQPWVQQSTVAHSVCQSCGEHWWPHDMPTTGTGHTWPTAAARLRAV